MATATNESASPLQRLVALEARKRALEEELEQVKKDRTAVEQLLLDRWADEGISSVNVDDPTMGRVNVHTRLDFYCNKRPEVSTDAICRTLEALGLGDMVAEQYNAARLKSWVKERVESDQVPDELAALLKFDSLPRVVVVKG